MWVVFTQLKLWVASSETQLQMGEKLNEVEGYNPQQ